MGFMRLDARGGEPQLGERQVRRLFLQAQTHRKEDCPGTSFLAGSWRPREHGA